MLTPFDDYPLHQTSQPLAIPASGDPNHYDRFFFNGYTADGSLYFGAAMGLYPNRQVIDASFSVVVDGRRQINVHASGRCPTDRTDTFVGPIRVEIIEPMKVLRIVVSAAEHGIHAELTYRARTEPVQEAPFHRRFGTRTVMDYTRLTQWGMWEGWLLVDGERIDVSPREVLGSRDRSWGVRGVGERMPGVPGPAPQFYWLWAPVNFPDVCIHFDVNEEADGRRWHESGFVVPVIPHGHGGTPETAPRSARVIDYRIAWVPGTRFASGFELDLKFPEETLTLNLTPMFNFQMMGIGYFHPTRSHGTWQGELSVVGDRWDLPVTDPLAITHLHTQALCRATMGDRVGTGILEQLVLGPHTPSGFSTFNDGAPTWV